MNALNNKVEIIILIEQFQLGTDNFTEYKKNYLNFFLNKFKKKSKKCFLLPNHNILTVLLWDRHPLNESL